MDIEKDGKRFRIRSRTSGAPARCSRLSASGHPLTIRLIATEEDTS